MNKNKFTLALCSALLITTLASCGSDSLDAQSTETAITSESTDTADEIITNDEADTPSEITEPVIFLNLNDENKTALSEELGVTTEELTTMIENKRDNMTPPNGEIPEGEQPPNGDMSKDENLPVDDKMQPPIEGEDMNNLPPKSNTNFEGGENMSIPIFEEDIENLSETTSKSYDDLLNILKQYEAVAPTNTAE